MAKDTFEIKGLDGLLAKFEGLKYETKYKGGRFALRKAAQHVRDQARENAIRLNDPQTGRSIAENISERWASRIYRRTGDLAFRLGILNGAVLPKKGEKPDEGAGAPTPHWRLLEFGTEKMAARPFLGPAVKSSIDGATTVLITEWSKAIDRALKRAAKGK